MVFCPIVLAVVSDATVDVGLKSLSCEGSEIQVEKRPDKWRKRSINPRWLALVMKHVRRQKYGGGALRDPAGKLGEFHQRACAECFC